MSDWLADIEPGAPDIISAWRGIEAGNTLSVRREVRRRAGTGSTPRILPQLEVLADVLIAVVDGLRAEALEAPGGEADWNVAQTVGHVATSRVGLAMAAGLAAEGRWPADAPTVIPGVPGPNADRLELVRKLRQSQRIVARSAGHVAGRETEPCPLEHPLVGRLRCGEWLIFAGVHDLMHLEQLHAIADRATTPAAAPRSTGRA
jgi:hypothetical protein